MKLNGLPGALMPEVLLFKPMSVFTLDGFGDEMLEIMTSEGICYHIGDFSGLRKCHGILSDK